MTLWVVQVEAEQSVWAICLIHVSRLSPTGNGYGWHLMAPSVSLTVGYPSFQRQFSHFI